MVRVRRQAEVLVAEEVVAQHGRVRQRLQDRRHEARVAQVDHPTQTCRGGRGRGRGQGDPLRARRPGKNGEAAKHRACFNRIDAFT